MLLPCAPMIARVGIMAGRCATLATHHRPTRERCLSSLFQSLFPVSLDRQQILQHGRVPIAIALGHGQREWPFYSFPLPSGLRLFAGSPSPQTRGLVTTCFQQHQPQAMLPFMPPPRSVDLSDSPNRWISPGQAVRLSPRVGICGCKQGQVSKLRKEIGR
jgi:hypothetical protein